MDCAVPSHFAGFVLFGFSIALTPMVAPLYAWRQPHKRHASRAQHDGRHERTCQRLAERDCVVSVKPGLGAPRSSTARRRVEVIAAWSRGTPLGAGSVMGKWWARYDRSLLSGMRSTRQPVFQRSNRSHRLKCFLDQLAKRRRRIGVKNACRAASMAGNRRPTCRPIDCSQSPMWTHGEEQHAKGKGGKGGGMSPTVTLSESCRAA